MYETLSGMQQTLDESSAFKQIQRNKVLISSEAGYEDFGRSYLLLESKCLERQFGELGMLLSISGAQFPQRSKEMNIQILLLHRLVVRVK